MYRLWSKCVPMNLKRTPMTIQIKLTHNFGPLSITFSLRHPFSAEMAIFCVFGHIEYQEPKPFQSKWPRWFFLVHWNTFLPQSKQNSKFLFFLHFYMSLWGYVKSWPPVWGGPRNWFQNLYHIWQGFFSKFLMGGLKIFGPHRGRQGRSRMGKKSDWSRNCPPNAKLGHFLLFYVWNTAF